MLYKKLIIGYFSITLSLWIIGGIVGFLAPAGPASPAGEGYRRIIPALFILSQLGAFWYALQINTTEKNLRSARTTVLVCSGTLLVLMVVLPLFFRMVKH